MRPGLDAFAFTEDELRHISDALKEAKPWDYEHVQALKSRVKAFLRALCKDVCCYCYRDFTGEFSFVIDIEHVLPKKNYKSLTFDIRNLSVACKRCNMSIKNDDLSFLNMPIDMGEIERSDKYKLVHPNIDTAVEHLLRIHAQVGNKRITKYIPVPNSSKGEFAYNYFRLSELEVGLFDLAQKGDAPDASDIAKILELLPRQET